MAAGVGEGVEQRLTGAVARDDMIGLIVVRLGDAQEEALGELGLGRQDVFNPPWGVQWFHCPRLMREGGIVKTAESLRGFEAALEDIDQSFDGQLDEQKGLGNEIIPPAHGGVGPAFKVDRKSTRL